MANLSARKDRWPVTKGVRTPVTPARTLEHMIVGRRPIVSESQPKNNIPGIAPRKKIVWESAGIQACSQTQSNSTVTEVWKSSRSYSQPELHFPMGQDSSAPSNSSMWTWNREKYKRGKIRLSHWIQTILCFFYHFDHVWSPYLNGTTRPHQQRKVEAGLYGF